MAPPGTAQSTRTEKNKQKNKLKREAAKRRIAEAKAKEDEEQKPSAKLTTMDIADASKQESVPSNPMDTNASTASAEIESPLSEIKPALGKGLGVFATKAISKGTEIFREAPLLSGGRPWLSKEAVFATFSEEKKRRFLGLKGRCKCGQDPCVETEFMKICDNNSFETRNGLTDADELNCVYEIGSRLNHSCVPNTSRKFTKKSNIVFRATENIKKGEEITTDYGGSCGPAQFRRQFFFMKYGFLCNCRACKNNQFLPFDTILGEIRAGAAGQIESNENGTEVLGKLTEQEITAEQEVEQWLKHLLACSHVLHQRLLGNIAAVCVPGIDAKKAGAAVLIASLKSWEKCLHDENKFGISEEALGKYTDRLSKTFLEVLKLQCNPTLALSSYFSFIRGTLEYEGAEKVFGLRG